MDKENKYIIWGSSGHAKVLADIIYNERSSIDTLFDNDPKAKSSISNIPLYIGIEGLNHWVNQRNSLDEYLGAIAIGGAKGKERLEIAQIFKNLGLKLPIIKHTTSAIALTAIIKEGSHILANSVISADTIIGKMCIVNNSASIDHECEIGDGVHIAPGAVLCGCVKIDKHAMIGAGAVVLPRLRIGENSIIGAGSIVVRDVPPNSVVVGNPAKKIKQK